MTIVDFAKETGLSKQAIYQKLKRKNIKLSDIQQPDNNELTQEGLFTLAELFKIKVEDNGKPIPASKEGVNVDSKKVNDNSAEGIIKRLEEENEQLKISIAELRAAAAVKDQLIDVLTARAEFAEKISLQHLPGEVERKPSLWQRITGRTKTERK